MGFLFPAIGLRLNQPSHMKTNEENESAKHPAPQLAKVARLSGIYLDAGLPLELAVRSALADCEIFDQPEVCET